MNTETRSFTYSRSQGDIAFVFVSGVGGNNFTNRVEVNRITATTAGAVNPSVTLAVNNSNIAEAAGVATVTASLSDVASQAVTVELAFSGTAVTSDYTRSAAQIVIPAGSTTGTVTLTAVQDGLDESNETVVVDISSVTNGTESGTQRVTATIIDDDDATGVPTADIVDVTPDPRSINAGTVTINFNESVSGVDIADFTLTRDGANVSLSGLSVAGTGSSRTINLATVTAAVGTYVLALTASGSGIQNTAGKALAVNASETWVVEPMSRSVIDLSTLDGTTGFRLNGIDTGDNSGHSVSSAGDVNGDGFDDLLIGAVFGDPNGDDSAGESYVVFGKSSGFGAVLDLATLDGTTGFRLDGIDAFDQSGFAVSSAGDVNGDGFDDLLIGAYGGDPNGDSYAGESYVVFGKSSGFGAVLDLATLDGTTGFRLDGIDSNDFSGFAVSSAGDVNGDGFDDLLIGAIGGDPNGDSEAGGSYVVFGKSSGFGAVLDLAILDGTTGFRLDGIDRGDRSGRAVSSAGDVNGDGFDDLLIGAYRASPNFDYAAGESYVVFGKSSGFGAVLDLAILDGTTGFRLDGIDRGDRSGRAVSSAGDLNGDGFDDLLIGAYRASPNFDYAAGESYVVFGKSSGFGAVLDLAILDGTTGFRLDGIDRGDLSGFAVSSAGDVNGDGFDDLLIGANLGDPNGKYAAGESYVVFGKSSGFGAALDLSTLDGTTGLRIDGIDADDRSGGSVSSAGDVNGDGFDDLLIGAERASPNGDIAAGESYVVFGGNFTGGAETQVGTSAANILTANRGVVARDVLVGQQGADTLVSDGGADVLYGGEGNDTLGTVGSTFQRVAGGSGTDTLRLDGSGITLNLTAIADNKLTDIEVIDLTGSGDNVLTLNQLEVLNLSSTSNTLLVRRNMGDTVDMDTGWTQRPDEKIGADVFFVFTQGAATLKVQSLISIVALSTLNGTNGFRLDGIDVDDHSGVSVSSAGDVNGDGYDDLLIGARGGDPHDDINNEDITDAGETYVVFGKSSGFAAALDLSTLNGTNGFRLNGIDYFDHFGASVSSAGDVNGDGVGDLLIGAYAANPNGDESAGESYVVFGKSSGFGAVLDLSTLNGTNGFRLDGIDEYDQSGRSVSSAGDVNGDGFDDLLIGASGGRDYSSGRTSAGKSYVVFGKSSGFPAALDLSTLNGMTGFRLDDSGPFVSSVSDAGDVNGDGFHDLIIGDGAANGTGGASYMVFGRAGGFAATLDLSTLDGSNGFRLDGIDPFDFSGTSVSSAGM